MQNSYTGTLKIILVLQGCIEDRDVDGRGYVSGLFELAQDSPAFSL
jgi:hypothetical protein